MKQRKATEQQPTSILGGFVPMAMLWNEAVRGNAGGLFQSEGSARWFIREHREALIQGEAIALHAGRTYIHPARFEAVAQRVAIEAARRRA